MFKRTKLSDRILPNYSKNEEIMNMTTHIAGGAIGLLIGLLCCIKALYSRDVYSLVGCIIFTVAMVALYSMSSIYHGLSAGKSKKVLQVLDHCTIYFLICGTYTPILLSAFRINYLPICIGLMIFQWILTFIAATLTAIDLHEYRIFSMICYISMGWSIFPFIPQTIKVMTLNGFILLLAGGISYTIGAILYGIGSKKHWFHSIFHIFVVIGTILQALSVLIYVI